MQMWSFRIQSRKFRQLRSMKFETVRIYFLREFSVYCHPKILLPWQSDVTTSPLYSPSCRYPRDSELVARVRNTAELQKK